MAEPDVTVRIRAEYAQFKRDLDAVAKLAESTGKKAEQAGKKTTKSTEEATKAKGKELKATQEAAQAAGLLYDSQGRLVTSLGKLVSARQAAEKGLANYSESVHKAALAEREAAKASEEAAYQSSGVMGRLMADARNNSQAWDTVGNSLSLAGGALVGFTALSITKFASFDKAMSGVQAATHETSQNMGLLREAAVEAGADTAYSAEEAAGAITELSKAGVLTTDVLNGGLTGALSLAAAGQLDVAKSAEIAASAMTQFKLGGEDIPHIADLLAAGAGKAQGSVEDMGMALNQAGLVANGYGLSIEETTGSLAAFASAGLIGSDAGTSLKTMLQRLTPTSKEAQKQMDELGISAWDAQGQFVGTAEYAGILRNAMKDMTPEARNAAMAVMYGADAVRAANVFYEQGQAGIQGWIDKVDDAGYAALTAAIQQDNLAGDLEKLGGSFDTLFLKAGGTGNDALRGLVQTGEDLLDMIGQIPAPVLATTASIAGIAGATALGVGGFMKLVPVVMDTYDAFRGLGQEGSKIPGVMGKITKSIGVAAVAGAALSIIGQAVTTREVKTTTDYAEAMLKVANAGEKASSSDLDSIFSGWDTSFGDTRGQLDGIEESIRRISNPEYNDGINEWADNAFSAFGYASSETTQVKDRLAELGDEMGALVASGSGESAAKTFSILAKEFENNGKSAQDALQYMPAYAESLRTLATESGVVLSDTELMNWALTGVKPASVTAAEGAREAEGALTDAGKAADATAQLTDEMAQRLADVGLSADGTIVSLSKFLDFLYQTGMATRDSKTAMFEWKDTIRDLGGEIDTILAKQGEAGAVLAKSQKDFNAETDAGAEAQAKFYEVIEQGLGVAKTYAADSSKSQKDVQAQLKSTYDQAVRTAVGFGMSSEAAAALAREALGIPDDVNINTWMEETARETALATAGAIAAIPGYTVVTVAVTEDGTAGSVQTKIDAITGQPVFMFVTDDGTTVSVQEKIVNIDGVNRTVYVDDKGTVYRTQGEINGIQGKTVPVTADAKTGTAEGQLNYTARTRYSQIVQTFTTSGVPFRDTSSLVPGAWRANGGRLPKRSSGGTLPYTGLGTDQILGVNSMGRPTAWVDDGEWIIRERSARKYDRALSLINSDHPSVQHLAGYAGGGRAGGGSGVAGVSVGDINIYGATDANAVRRAVMDEITYKLGTAGVRIG